MAKEKNDRRAGATGFALQAGRVPYCGMQRRQSD